MNRIRSWLTRLNETGPAVPRSYYRAVVALNYCYLLCMAIHAVLVVVFFSLGEYFLATFNVGSLALFAFCLHLNAVRDRFRLPVILATIEILVHAALCVVTFGWAAGFHYYAIALGVSTFIIPWWSALRKLGLVALVGVTCVGLNAWSRFHPPLTELPPHVLYSWEVANLLILIASLALIGYAVTSSSARAEQSLDDERRRSETLLHNILPVPIAERLLTSPSVIADRFEGATILFCDIVGFTVMSERVPAENLVSMLNAVFTRFDRLTDRTGLEKIKTIGDAYMVTSGLPNARPDHAVAAAAYALAMREELAAFNAETGASLSARIGIHSGPAVAGVIGFRKFAYDVWGDTVNTASRMESHGLPGRIQISEATWALVRDVFLCEPRGEIEVKGKGTMRTYWLVERDSGS